MYRGRLERDLNGWAAKGLLDPAIVPTLLADYDQRESAFSLGRVLMAMAALLIGGAVVLLIAANWEAIPRVARLVGIVALIWSAYLNAAYWKSRNSPRLSEASLVAGLLFFGGGIALVGQMYHLSGDSTEAAIVWFIGAVLTAVLFRSSAATAVCGFLAFVVAGTEWSESFALRNNLLLWLMPAMAAVVIGLVRFTGAGRTRHLAYLLMVCWVLILYGRHEAPLTALVVAAAGGVCYLLAALPASPLYRLARNAGAAPSFYSFLLLMMGLLLLHFDVEGLLEQVVLGVATLVAAIAGLFLSGRDNGAVRYLAYAAFAAETLYLSSETLGTILGTSGFFMISGLVVALVAWVVVRLERRFSARSGVAEAGR